jgi:5'-3' exonuclease
LALPLWEYSSAAALSHTKAPLAHYHVVCVCEDGVAPRAKMNQQRSRRFKAIKESKEKAEKEAEIMQEMLRMGKEIPQKEDKAHVSSSSILSRACCCTPVSRSCLTLVRALIAHLYLSLSLDVVRPAVTL